LQTRYYDAEVGRFLNADSIEYLDLETINGCNLYAYGLNNPILFCDPTGHWVLVAKILISTAVSLLTELVIDVIDDGKINTDGKEYLKAGISGMISGVTGHFVKNIVVDSLISTAVDVGMDMISGEYEGVEITSVALGIFCDFANDLAFGFVCYGMDKIVGPDVARKKLDDIIGGKRKYKGKTEALKAYGIDINYSKKNESKIIEAIHKSFETKIGYVIQGEIYQGIGSIASTVTNEAFKKNLRELMK